MIESSVIHSICYLPYEDYKSKIHSLKNFFSGFSQMCGFMASDVWICIYGRVLKQMLESGKREFFYFYVIRIYYLSNTYIAWITLISHFFIIFRKDRRILDYYHKDPELKIKENAAFTVAYLVFLKWKLLSSYALHYRLYPTIHTFVLSNIIFRRNINVEIGDKIFARENDGVRT